MSRITLGVLSLWSALAWSAESKVTLVVFGSPDKAEVERVRGALGKLASVGAVAVGEADKQLARLDVTLKAGGGLELAQQMDAAKDIPLHVEKASAAQVVTRFDPAHAARVPYWVRAFEDKSKDKKHAEAARLATEEARILFRNASYLTQASTVDEAALIFVGRLVVNAADEVVYEVKIKKAKGGEIGFAKGKGPHGLPEAVLTLIKSMPERLSTLESAVFVKDASLLSLPHAVDRSRKAMPILLTKVEVGSLGGAADAPITTLWLEGRNGAAPEQVVPVVEVQGFSAGPHTGTAVKVAPGGATKVPLVASVDAARVSRVQEAAVTPVQVELTWKHGDYERSETLVVPVRVGAKAP